MNWFRSLFGQKKQTAPAAPKTAPTPTPKPVRTPAMERTLTLYQSEWVDEQLAGYPLERLLAIKGLQSTHLELLRKAGLHNLRQVWECESLPLMGSTTTWVREWLEAFIKDLELEYQALRKAAEKFS